MIKIIVLDIWHNINYISNYRQRRNDFSGAYDHAVHEIHKR